MLGTIIGDIAGSRFQHKKPKTNEFELLTSVGGGHPTNVSDVLLSVAKAILDGNDDYSKLDQLSAACAYEVGCSCGFAASSLEQAIDLTKSVGNIFPSNSEKLNAAEAISTAIFLARSGKSILEIQDHINDQYFKIDFTLDNVHESESPIINCKNSAVLAFGAFFESIGFEDAIRKAISIGGDGSTIAAISGSLAEAYYGIPIDLRKHIVNL